MRSLTLLSPKIKTTVALKIKHEIFYNRFGVAEATRVLLEGDEQILAALELLPEAGNLAARARGEIAQRR